MRYFKIDVPLFDEVSDDDLSDWFPDIDGAWSRQTRSLIASHGASGLDLDSIWARTPPGWLCPGCGRNKAGIAVTTPTNILLCHLVEHHDHCGDLGRHLVDQRFGDKAKALVALYDHVLDGARLMVTRFTRTTLCPQCNTADADAKRAVHADRFFSFSPDEIRQFVQPVDNSPRHEIDKSVARDIWESQRHAHDVRTGLAQAAADAVGLELMRLEKSASTFDHAYHPTSEKAILLKSLPQEISTALAKNLAKVRTRMVSGANAGGSSARRPKSRTAASRAPTSEEILAHDGGYAWKVVDETWRCPGCDRTRNETMRLSKSQSRWTGHLHEFHEHRIVDDTDLKVRLVRYSVAICRDCLDACGIAKKRTGLDPMPAVERIRSALVEAPLHDKATHDYQELESAVRDRQAWLDRYRKSIDRFDTETGKAYYIATEHARGLTIDGTHETAVLFAAYRLNASALSSWGPYPPRQEEIARVEDALERSAIQHPRLYPFTTNPPLPDTVTKFWELIQRFC